MKKVIFQTRVLCLKMDIFSLILVGYKHKILITQEDIYRREIVEVKFMGEKIKEKNIWEAEDKFKERNLGGKLGE